MKDKILAIVRFRARLEELCDRTDIKMEKVGAGIGTNTALAIAKIERLIDLKIRLVNFSVIFEHMIKGLSESELLILSMRANENSLSAIGEELGISITSAMRYCDKILKRCERRVACYDLSPYADLIKSYMHRDTA